MSGKRSIILRNFILNDQNERFLLLFHHNTINSDFFISYEEFLNTNSIYKYSILGYIDDSFKSTDDSYEFILEYPETSKYAHFLQKVNPLCANENDDIGYQNINITWEIDEKIPFIGLHIADRNEKSFLDGTKGLNEDNLSFYYYSIGLRKSWYGNLLPGYIYNYNPNPLHEVYLWLKITNLELLKRIPLFLTCPNINVFPVRKFVFISIFLQLYY